MNKTPIPEDQSRIIRVFVSSTFRDMQAERDELVKFIFPQLRKLCEQRGVAWGEVDLRWGISDEQKSEGKVLPICLDEIRRCRPYFIGVLGERYGWVPDEISPELIEREKWLTKLSGHSVTELEILHGVLNNPDMAQHAFFYFRNPGYLDTLLPEQRAACLESDSAEDINKYGGEEAHRRTEQRKQKLAELKERIRKSGFPVNENYQDPKEFGQTVLRDLTAIIDRLYPEGSQPEPLDREAAENEVFARSRAQVYIGRQAYFDKLDAHALSESQPMVILGDSGSGKSALLANWAMNYRTEHPGELVLMHFIGATPGSADWSAMLRRIMGEFKRKFDIREEIPDQPDALRSAFANWLNMAAARGRVVLVLDGLNQLDDRDGAPDLVWLPPHIPGNVRIFLSTLPGRSLEELEKRGWPALTIEPLQPDERKQLIKEYLALFTKALDSAHTKRIASAGQCQNPLFLRVLLDELRQFGMHEHLGDQIKLYLKAPTIPALYELIVRRCEQDYERERPGLVGEAMSLLWAARRGLSEAELMELLGTNGLPLPRAYWSPLYLALEGSLFSPEGLIGFGHIYLRQAVQARYLSNEKTRRLEHLRLAGYFESRELDRRKVEELPWQLAQAEDWSRLAGLLADLDFFSTAWQTRQHEVKAYWTTVETHSALIAVGAYQPVFDAPQQHMAVVREISFLMADIGHMHEAILLSEFMVRHYRQEGRKDLLIGALTNLEILFQMQGRKKEAAQLEQEANRLVQKGMASPQNRIAAENNKAAMLRAGGDVSGALEIWENLAIFCREHGHVAELPAIMNNIGNSQTALGNWDDALERYRESEKLCQVTGDSAALVLALTGQANVLGCLSRNEEAFEIAQKAAQLCRDLGDKRSLHAVLSSQVVLCMGSGTLADAYPLALEEEQIARELGDQEGLASTLVQLGLIEQSRGNIDLALARLREGEKISRWIGSKDVLHGAIANQATILRKQGRLKEALKMQKEVEQICREIGDLRALQTSLGNQGNILFDMNDTQGALELFRQKVAICRQIGFVSGLALGLSCQGIALMVLGRHREALECADEATPLAEQYQLTAIKNQLQQIYRAFGR